MYRSLAFDWKRESGLILVGTGLVNRWGTFMAKFSVTDRRVFRPEHIGSPKTGHLDHSMIVTDEGLHHVEVVRAFRVEKPTGPAAMPMKPPHERGAMRHRELFERRNMDQSTEHTGIDDLLDASEIICLAEVKSKKGDHPGSFVGANDRPAILARVRHRLLQVNMFAGLDCSHRHFAMGELGCGDQNRIHVSLTQEFVGVGEAAHVGMPAVLAIFAQPVLVDVANPK